MLHAGRLRWTLVLAASLIFVAAGVLVFIMAPNGRVAAIVAILFFGFGAVVAVLQMVTGRLELSPRGFTLRGLGRTSTTAWSDVTSFSVVTPTAAWMKMVEVELADTETLRHTRAAVKAVAGAGRLLPDMYGMKPEDLAALMNQWRSRYAGGS